MKLFVILIALPPLFWATPVDIDADRLVAEAVMEINVSLEPAKDGETELTSLLRESMTRQTTPLDIGCIPDRRMPICD